MSDDLDLRGIDHRHEPDPQFRAALQRRVAAIVAGTDPGSVTEARDLATIDLELTSATSVPKRNLGRFAAAIVAAAAAVVAIVVVVETRDDEATPADQPSPAVTVPPGPRSLPSTTTPPRPLPTSGDPLAHAGDVLRRRGRRNTDAADLRHPRRRVGDSCPSRRVAHRQERRQQDV